MGCKIAQKKGCKIAQLVKDMGKSAIKPIVVATKVSIYVIVSTGTGAIF